MKIVSDSHTDHVTEAHLAWLVEHYVEREGFFVDTVAMEDLPPVACGLHGPETGDDPVPDEECRMVTRDGREWPSRVCSRPSRMTHTLTVIAGPYNGETVLYTAYGGPCAPREPGDPDIADEAERARSEAFWAVHALSE